MKMDDLQALVEKELADERYITRTHGRGSTYKAGCKGPLCQRVNRSRQRTLRAGEQASQGYQAILDQMLEPFQKAHDSEREELLQAKGA